MRPRSPISVMCQNHECDYFGKEDGKDIIRRGKNKAGHQQYLCYHCEKVFLETANTLMFQKHLPKTEIYSIVKLIGEDKSIREISKITKHNKDVINHMLNDFVLYSNEINGYLLNKFGYSRSDTLEFWLLIKNKKQRNNDTAKRIEKIIQKIRLNKS